MCVYLGSGVATLGPAEGGHAIRLEQGVLLLDTEPRDQRLRLSPTKKKTRKRSRASQQQKGGQREAVRQGAKQESAQYFSIGTGAYEGCLSREASFMARGQGGRGKLPRYVRRQEKEEKKGEQSTQNKN